MQHDEIIWTVLSKVFCCNKVCNQTQTFCRNRFNVTGLCTRKSCPLANSRYATILEENGKLYLYTKVIERAHSPAHMWEKLRLSKNYEEALKQIDDVLQYWPWFSRHKVKQRLTKITEMLLRMRRLRLKPVEELQSIRKKVERRERSREAKALSAAQIEKAIQRELLTRLSEGAYGDIYNFNQQAWENALEEMGGQRADEEEEEDGTGDEEETDEERELERERLLEEELAEALDGEAEGGERGAGGLVGASRFVETYGVEAAGESDDAAAVDDGKDIDIEDAVAPPPAARTAGRTGGKRHRRTPPPKSSLRQRKRRREVELEEDTPGVPQELAHK